MCLNPGSGIYPGEGNGNPLQYSGLENPMDRGAWWAAVHGVKKSATRQKRLSSHTHAGWKGCLWQALCAALGYVVCVIIRTTVPL